MKCPFCNSTASRVAETRPLSNTIHRKRECRSCDRFYWTEERYTGLNRPKNIDKLSAIALASRPKFFPKKTAP